MESPLVSVLIPAYNRPDFLEMALKSVLEQTYNNIEIVICDDSTNFEVKNRIAPYLRKYKNIKYIKNSKNLFVKNWHRCFQASSGEYINFLMDDDLFHPDKIRQMMVYFLSRNDISLVTSYRKIINEKGEPRNGLRASRVLSDISIIDGVDLGNYVLTNGRNVIGEPTTVLFKRKALKEPFGMYYGKQYINNNDVASWISLLSIGKAVYIPKELSYFRIHSGQNQQKPSIMSTAFQEWTDLIVESRKDGFLKDPLLFRSALYTQDQNMNRFLSLPKYKPFQHEIRQVKQKIISLLDEI